MILFLSKYPETPQEYRDGFFQRVVSIDKFYSNDERVYLHTSLFRNWNKKKRVNGLRTDISCNIILHFFTILDFFNRSSLVYIQSIYNAIYTVIFILIFKRFYVLDLHGVVPEELKMQKKKIHYILFTIVESFIFYKVSVCVAVTKKMVTHFEKKYPKSKCQYIVYCILPNHLKEEDGVSENESKIKSEKIEIIYSGNAQVWQNVDLMLQYIKQNISENINYTILTGDIDEFKEKIKKFNLKLDDVLLKSVKPEELKEYYKKSNYGFILRDDIIVNKVACPTKMVEYLHYGITPIVLSDEIGDFKDFGFDHVNLNQCFKELPIKKSLNNNRIVKEIFKINNFNLKTKINDLIEVSVKHNGNGR